MLPTLQTEGTGYVFALENLLAMGYGALGGALVTIVALRTRLAMMNRDISDNKRATEKLERDIDRRLETMDRRSIFLVQLMADIARKVGADGRFSDQMIRMLSEESARETQRERERDTAGGL